MIVVLFRSRLSPNAGQDYSDMAVRMLEAAKGMPGFVDFKSFKADDGERLSVVRWTDLETMEAWRTHAGHQEAKRQGRATWYDESTSKSRKSGSAGISCADRFRAYNRRLNARPSRRHRPWRATS